VLSTIDMRVKQPRDESQALTITLTTDNCTTAPQIYRLLINIHSNSRVTLYKHDESKAGTKFGSSFQPILHSIRRRSVTPAEQSYSVSVSVVDTGSIVVRVQLTQAL